MKKLIIVMVAAACALAPSCSTVYKTASVQQVKSPVTSATIADIEVVGPKITYTCSIPKRVAKVGIQNSLNAAVSEALANAGKGGDVLIDMQYSIERRWVLFGGNRVRNITVTGIPARYTNFRSANDKTLQKIVLQNEGISKRDHSSVPAVRHGLFGKK